MFKITSFIQKNIQRFFAVKKTQIEYTISQDPRNNIKNLLNIYYNENSIKTRLITLILKFRMNWIFQDDIDILIKSKNESVLLKNIIETEDFYKKLNAIVLSLELQNHCLLLFEIDKENKEVNFNVIDLLDIDYDIRDDGVYILQNNDYIKLNEDSYLLFNYSNKNKFTNSILCNSLSIINKIESVEKDIRKIHEIFAKQVPVFKFSDEMRINDFYQYQNNYNTRYNLGDSLLLLKDEDFDFKTANLQNIESLFKEKLFLYQELSALTGVPIFLLGFPELIGGGRATAKEYIELISVSVKKQRLLFKYFIKSLLRKILYLRNKNFQEVNNINVDIEISIPETINSIVFEIIDVLNDMRRNGFISQETYLNLNPLIKNTNEELAKLEEEKNKLSEQEINILGGNL
jgi:hypothetical protein